MVRVGPSFLNFTHSRKEDTNDAALLQPFYPHCVVHGVYAKVVTDSLVDVRLETLSSVRAHGTQISPYLSGYVNEFLKQHPLAAQMTDPMVKLFTGLAIMNQHVIKSLYKDAASPTGNTPLSNCSGRLATLSPVALYSC